MFTLTLELRTFSCYRIRKSLVVGFYAEFEGLETLTNGQCRTLCSL